MMKPCLTRICWRRTGCFLCSSLNSGMRMTSWRMIPFPGTKSLEMTCKMGTNCTKMISSRPKICWRRKICRRGMRIAIYPMRSCNAKAAGIAMWCHTRRCLCYWIEKKTNIFCQNSWRNPWRNMNFERDTSLRLIFSSSCAKDESQRTWSYDRLQQMILSS